ncbi:MAG: SDR family oxidoreductase [Deinococcales bacterium]|jgi:uncharacterized protein YbjT (DUF2867 family)
MNTLVVGAAGRTGAHILRMMLAAHLGSVRGLVRKPEQRDAVAAFGAEPVLVDLAEEAAEDGSTALGEALAGVDALIYAVGAGSAEQADAVDRRGAVRLIGAAEQAGILRFLLISSMGTDRPESMPAALRPFLEAKREAEEALQASGLAWTIVRPGGLTDDPPTGRVRIAPSLGSGGTVPRADVARVAVAALRLGLAERQAFDLLAGDTPVDEALQGLASSQG